MDPRIKSGTGPARRHFVPLAGDTNYLFYF